MRVSSTMLSLAAHTALAIVVIHTSAVGRAGTPPRPVVMVMPPAPGTADAPPRPNLPAPPPIDEAGLTLPIAVPAIALQTFQPAMPVGVGSGGRVLASVGAAGWLEGPIDAALTDEYPEILSGPPPAYPELLRQAGISGRVVLEAIVDTAGRVERQSIVVLAGHPAFAAAAERALAGTLFRPARVRGRAVRVRVRVPFDFALARGRR